MRGMITPERLAERVCRTLNVTAKDHAESLTEILRTALTETGDRAIGAAKAVCLEVAEDEAEAGPASVELVSLEDAEAEQQGKKPAAEGAAAAAEGEEVEIDESLDDAAFIEEEEEGDPDVTDIIGETIEKEEET